MDPTLCLDRKRLAMALVRATKMEIRTPFKDRKTIFLFLKKLQRGRCCGTLADGVYTPCRSRIKLELEHIIELRFLGRHDIRNLQLMCHKCHSGFKTPTNAKRSRDRLSQKVY